MTAADKVQKVLQCYQGGGELQLVDVSTLVALGKEASRRYRVVEGRAPSRHRSVGMKYRGWDSPHQTA